MLSIALIENSRTGDLAKQYVEQGKKIPCFGLEFDSMEEAVDKILMLFPEYGKNDVANLIWFNIVDKFCAEVVLASGGCFELGGVDKYRGIVKNTEESYYRYITSEGDCNVENWNNGYLAKNFDLFRENREVHAPLVFENGEEFYKFVMKVQGELEKENDEKLLSNGS